MQENSFEEPQRKWGVAHLGVHLYSSRPTRRWRLCKDSETNESRLLFVSLTSKTDHSKPLLDFLQTLDKLKNMQAKQFNIKEEIPAVLYNGNNCGATRKRRSHFRNSCNLLLISGLRGGVSINLEQELQKPTCSQRKRSEPLRMWWASYTYSHCRGVTTGRQEWSILLQYGYNRHMHMWTAMTATCCRVLPCEK